MFNLTSGIEEVDVMRVLVVDDDVEVRAAVRMMLAANGFETAVASNVMEALRALRNVPVNVVLCDLFMPDMDGFELLRTTRRGFPRVKFIAMSGGGTDGALDLLPMALHLGANCVLYKPFDRIVVLAAIKRVLQAR